MRIRPSLAITAVCLSLIAASVSAGGNDAGAAPPGAQALQGSTSGSIQQRAAKCPVTADDFAPIIPGKAQEVCVYSKGVNLQEFCGTCLCSIYSLASQSLGNNIIPTYNATAADVYGTLFSSDPAPFYDSGLKQCDQLVTTVLTNAGAFPPNSWKGVDICMSLSSSRELLDLSRSSESCDLGGNIKLEVAAAQTSGSYYASTQWWMTMITIAAAALLHLFR